MQKTSGISNTTKVVLITEFVFVAYMLYVLTSSIYHSYQIDQYIAQFDMENEKIAEENRRLSEDFAYYTSEAYQERIAKQNFGLIKPGEQVIVLPVEDVATFEDEEAEQTKNIKRWNRLSNPQKWWVFFFEGQRF
jgi:cell division protein FtsB